jgi:hypothetical protein
MRLMRFKDNTYIWLSNLKDESISPVMNEKESLAYGVWQLKIDRGEVNLAINHLKLSVHHNEKKDNIAIFSDDQKIYLYTTSKTDQV